MIVVIVGIFLGLQVQAAYEDQLEREQELVYLNQLHEEVISALDVAQGRYENSTYSNEMLHALVRHFAGIAEIDDLTNAHCRVLMNSHFLRNIIITLPTITEIMSSGQFALISDQKLKSAITNYTLDIERNETTLESAARGINRLSSLFPRIIRLGPLEDLEVRGGASSSATCDFGAMMDNIDFQNELITNHVRQDSVTRQFPQQLALLNEMHAELDRLLDLTHKEPTA